MSLTTCGMDRQAVQTTFTDVKNNSYSDWQRKEPRNRAYLAVADELVRQMQELKVA